MAKESRKLKKLTEQSREHLDPNEEVLFSVLGAYETKILGSDSVRNGAFLATDQRLVFYAKKLTGYDLESFPYSNISSFEASKGIMGHSISFFASGNEVKMKWINDGDVKGFMEHLRNAAGKKVEKETTTDENSKSVVDELKDLAQLRDQGILTDEEFQKQKEKILS